MYACVCFLDYSKTTQRNKQIAMGRKKFNMDPKKVRHPLASQIKFETVLLSYGRPVFFMVDMKLHFQHDLIRQRSKPH